MQADIHRGRQSDRKIHNIESDRETSRQTHTETDKQTDMQAGIQTDIRLERQTIH